MSSKRKHNAETSLDSDYKRTRRDSTSSYLISDKKNDTTQPVDTTTFHIEKILPTLDKDSLVAVLTSLLALYPQLSTPITSLIPRPTITSLTQILHSLHQRLEQAYPYSKHGIDRSDYSFNRTRPVLQEIRETIVNYIPYYTSRGSYKAENVHEFPDRAMSFLHTVTEFVHRLPIWTTESNNIESKHEVYTILSKVWINVINQIGTGVRDEGKLIGSGAIGEWARQVGYHAQVVGGHFGFRDVGECFNGQLGWLVGNAMNSMVVMKATGYNGVIRQEAYPSIS